MVAVATRITPEPTAQVPVGWIRKPLSEIAPLQRGFDLPFHQMSPGPYPVIASNGIIAHHVKAMAKGPGVVTGRSGTLGAVHYTTEDYWPHNTALWVTDFCGNSPRFISYLYSHIGFDRFGGGSGVPTLNRNDVHDFEVAIPERRTEQNAIAEALSDVDAYIASLEQLLAKKRAVVQGAMQELLCGKSRLPGFFGNWRTVSLGSIAHIKTGDRNAEDADENGMYPFFVRSAQIQRINLFSHDCEAILIPGEGGIGSIFHYIHGRFSVHQRVYAITEFVPNVVGRYVYYYMKTYFGRHAMQNSVKATVDSLRLPTFQAFTLALPPSSDEQMAISNVLSDMDTDIGTLEATIDKVSAIKRGMMQDLLTGKVRLV